MKQLVLLREGAGMVELGVRPGVDGVTGLGCSPGRRMARLGSRLSRYTGEEIWYLSDHTHRRSLD